MIVDEGPFREGHRYRVKRNFIAMRDQFSEGEILSYRYCAWSRYDGIRGFFFATAGVDDMRLWDLPDNESIDVWTTFFEPVDDGSAANDGR